MPEKKVRGDEAQKQFHQILEQSNIKHSEAMALIRLFDLVLSNAERLNEELIQLKKKPEIHATPKPKNNDHRKAD